MTPLENAKLSPKLSQPLSTFPNCPQTFLNFPKLSRKARVFFCVSGALAAVQSRMENFSLDKMINVSKLGHKWKKKTGFTSQAKTEEEEIPGD
jgi:hypothetical protein